MPMTSRQLAEMVRRAAAATAERAAPALAAVVEAPPAVPVARRRVPPSADRSAAEGELLGSMLRHRRSPFAAVEQSGKLCGAQRDPAGRVG